MFFAIGFDDDHSVTDHFVGVDSVQTESRGFRCAMTAEGDRHHAKTQMLINRLPALSLVCKFQNDILPLQMVR